MVFSPDNTHYELNLDRYEQTRPLPPSTYVYADLVRSGAERRVAGTFMRWNLFGVGRREPSPESMSPDGRWITGIENHNLVFRATVDGQTVKFTTDGTPFSLWDVECTWWNPWSPGGLRLAGFKHYSEGVGRFPTIEWLKPWEQSREFIAMPAGGSLYRSELYLIDGYSLQPRAKTSSLPITDVVGDLATPDTARYPYELQFSLSLRAPGVLRERPRLCPRRCRVAGVTRCPTGWSCAESKRVTETLTGVGSFPAKRAVTYTN